MKPIYLKTGRILILVIGTVLLSGSLYFISGNHKENNSAKRAEFEKLLVKLNREAPRRDADKKGEKDAADEPGIAAYHEFLMTFDPATGTVPRERLIDAISQTNAQMKSAGSATGSWQGYESDMGGRTRAIMYDPNDPAHKKVWAGGVTGGLWYNTDITNAASPWVPVGDLWASMAIRCIAYDPLHPQRLYVGTGEAETALQTYRESSGLGFGIYKSENGGTTWSQIPGTESFVYVTDIVCRVEGSASVMYVGVASGLYKGSQHQSMPSDGLFRSADNGATWQQVLPKITGSTVPYCVSDIALGADNRLYVGTRPNLNGEGGAVLLYSDNGLNWTVNAQYRAEILADPTYNIPGRVVLGTSPADTNVVYALIASGFVNSANGFNYFYCNHILRSSDRGVTWVKKAQPTDLNNAPNFANIAWHAMDIAVDPNNANYLFIGGLDIHRSYNGGANWSRLSDWSKMYSGGGYDYIHADQHTIVFKPGSSDEMCFGSDGGVFFTSDGSAVVPTFSQHNKGYSTLQVYTCALNPIAGFNQFYGGLQDNGSLFYLGLGDPLTIADMVSGGDGAYCFFSDLNPALSITSIYYNSYMIFYNGNFQNYATNWSSGTFVSPADLDTRQEALYCNAVDYLGNWQDQILRIENLESNPTGTFFTLNTGTQGLFTALKYSPYSSNTSTTLFIGSEAGRLFRVREAQTNTPVVSEIGSTSFPASSISSIAIGKSEDTLMVTFSNYGVASVWKSFNGGQSWQDIEGNLPDMPVRWALFHPQKNKQAMVATETGVWQCADITQPSPYWQPINQGMANVRVDMLQLRKADNTVLAATHGRGFFTMVWDIASAVPEVTGRTAAVSPNPSAGIFRVSVPGYQAGDLTFSVTDMTGKVVYRNSAPPASNTVFPVDLSGKAPGVYLLSVRTQSKVVLTEKLVVEL